MIDNAVYLVINSESFKIPSNHFLQTPQEQQSEEGSVGAVVKLLVPSYPGSTPEDHEFLHSSWWVKQDNPIAGDCLGC